MLASITPLGERGRGQRFGITAAAYLLGSALGAAGMGAVLGLLGAALLGGIDGWVRSGLLAVGALVAAGVDARRLGIRSWHRQVNEDWLAEFRGWVYGFGFGFQLGLGVVTIVTTAAIYLMWAAAFLAADGAIGLTVGVVFGTARALPLLAGARLATPDAVAARVRRIEEWDGRFRTVTAGVEIAVGALFVVAAVGL